MTTRARRASRRALDPRRAILARLPRRVARPAGDLVRRPGGRRHRAPRAERRRQDDDAPGADGARAALARQRLARRRRRDAAPDARRRAARRRLRAGGPRRLRRAHRRGEPPARRAGRRRRATTSSTSSSPSCVSAPRSAPGRCRGPAADGRDRAGAPQREPAAARRRADEGLAPLLVTEVAAALERAAELTTILLVEQNLPVVAAPRARRRRARRGPGRPRRPGGGAARRPRPRPPPARRPRGWRIEHLRPAHDHGPRSRGDVLPRRLGPVAHLRADGRPQLRARRADHGRRLRGVVVRRPDRRRLRAAAARRRRARDRRRRDRGGLIELVLIRPLYRRPIEQVLVTVGLALALGALVQGIWGHDPKPFPVPVWMFDTTTILGANVPNDRFVEIGVAAAVLVGLVGVPALHALRARDPRGRREPGDGEGARDRRAAGVHDRLRARRRARGAGGRPLGRLLRQHRPRPRHVAPHLRLHRRRDRRLRLDRRHGGRRGRRRADPAVRELLRLERARATSRSSCCSPPCSSSGPRGLAPKVAH